MSKYLLYKKSFNLLSKKDKKRLFILILSSVFNGLLQFSVLIGVIPFVNLIIKKDNFFNTKMGSYFQNTFHINDVNILLICTALSLIILIFFKNFYSWFHIGLIAKFISTKEVKMRNIMLQKVMYSSYAWIRKYNTNYLREVVFNYSGAWSSQFIKPLLLLKNELIVFLFILSTLFVLNPKVVLIILGISCVIGIMVIYIVKNKIYFLEEKKRNAFVKAADVLINAFNGIKDIKMSQSENHFFGKFQFVSSEASKAEAERQQWAILPKLIIETFAYSIVLFILVFLIFFERNFENSISLIAVYVFAAFRVMPLLSSLIVNTTAIINVTPLLENLLKIMNEAKSIEINNKSNLNLNKKIELKDISFTLSLKVKIS